LLFLSHRLNMPIKVCKWTCSLLIALRDDRHLLNDPEGLINGTWMEAGHGEVAEFDKLPTLYPNGFSSSRFVEVIESEAVWEETVHSPIKDS
jgi:hypothetical protein